MDQIMQLQNNLRQVKQNLNSVLGQINQQLTSSEQIAQNIGTTLTQQRNQPVGGQFGVSQYQPNLTGTTGTFGTGANNAWDQPSMVRGGGVNQFGAQYSSGHLDENLGAQSFAGRSQYNPVQSNITGFGTAGTGIQSTVGQSQYNPIQNTGAVQTGNDNYWDTASMVRGAGVNQFGARYSSGNQDSDVGQAYYQNQHGAQSFAGRSQYNPNLSNVATGNLSNLATGNLSNQTAGGANLSGSQFIPAQNFTGQNQYNPGMTNQTGSNNYWDTPSMLRNAGGNSFGAQYSSGHQDQGVGQAYYQMQGTQSPIRNQFGMEAGSVSGNTQNARNNSYDQPSMVRNFGGNQYGAMSSGKQDENVGQSYYQSKNY